MQQLFGKLFLNGVTVSLKWIPYSFGTGKNVHHAVLTNILATLMAIIRFTDLRKYHGSEITVFSELCAYKLLTPIKYINLSTLYGLNKFL